MPPRHTYHHIRHPSEARSGAGTVSPLSSPLSPLSPLSTLASLRTVSTRARSSLRRKRGAWERPVSPLSDTYEEEDAEAVREAVAAGVPFLEMGDVEWEREREREREWEREVESTGTGGWGAPGWSGLGSLSESRSEEMGTEREGGFVASEDGYIAVPEVGHIHDSRGTEEQGAEERTTRRAEGRVIRPAEERAVRPAVDPRGTGVHETALEAGWRPGYLRRRVILSFAAVFAVLLTIVEVLAGVDKARGGLGDGSVPILWGYVPTILLVIVAALWRRLEFQAKRYTPWILLSQGPNRPADALLLDYANASLPTALYTSIRKRHFLVLCPLVTMLMLVVGIVLSTGVFVRVEEVVERGEVPAVLLDRFVLGEDAELPTEGTAQDPVAALVGVTRGLGFPEGYTLDLAYQTFQPAGDEEDLSFRMEVDTISVQPECETATVEGLVERGIVQTNLTVASSMCGGNIPVALNPWSTNTTGDQYHFVYEDLEHTGSCGDKPLVLASVFQTRPTSDGGFEHGESAAVVCRVPFYSGTRNVTFSPNGGYTVLPKVGDDERVERSFSDLIHYSLGYNETYEPAVTGDTYMMSELPLAFALAASLSPSRPSSTDDFLEGESLGDMMEDFFTTFAPLVAHYNLREDSSAVSSGTATTKERRLRVVSGIAHSMAALFGASLLLTLSLMLFVPRRGITPRCPNSVAGTASLLVNSEDIFSRLQGADTSSLKAIAERLRGSYYSTVELSPGARRFIIKNTLSEGTAPEVCRSPGAPNGYNPWPLRLVPRIASLMLVGAITGTLWALLSTSRNDQGLASISDPYRMAILWTCLPAAILVAAGAYLGSVDFHTRFLVPFAALYKQDTFAAGMMGTYTDELAPVTVYKATRARNWVVLLAKGAAVGAALFPVLICRVFTAEEMVTEKKVEVRQTEWFGGEDGAPAVDLAGNGSNPWIHGDLVFPRVEVEDVKDASVEVTLPAARAELTCEPLEPSDGNLWAVECELLDAKRGAMCGQTNDFFGHVATGCKSTTTGEEFSGFMHYLWGSCAEGVPVRREIVSCEEKVVEVQVEATLRDEKLSMVKAKEDAETRRDTNIELPTEGMYDLPGATDPWFDAFFTFLSRTTPLDDDTPLEEITDAITSQHSLLRTQDLAATRTPTTSRRPGTKTYRTTRLLQNRVETYLLAILLTLTLGFAAASLMVAPRRVLPCSPGCIGAVAGMLAEWGGRARVVPLGAEWMGDRELARYFGG